MNDIVKIQQPPAFISLFLDPLKFDQAQRAAKALAMTQLMPDHLRKGDRDAVIANTLTILDMAERLREHPLSIAQAIYFVGGKAGWSSSWMIGKANQSGVFKDVIDWEIKGKGDDLSVTAMATLAATGRAVKVTCDMKMAKMEGWTKNPKYQSMPEQMLRYRSAAFLIRLYAPEVLFGLPATIEVESGGIIDVTPYDPVTGEVVAENEIQDATGEAESKAEEEAEAKKKAEEEARMKAAAEADEKAVAENKAAIEAELAAKAAKAKALAAKAKANADAEAALEAEARRVAEEREKASAQGSLLTEGASDKTDKTDKTPEPAALSEKDTMRLQRTFDMIQQDLLDATDPDDVFDMYRDYMAELDDKAPKLAADLREIAAARKAGGND